MKKPRNFHYLVNIYFTIKKFKKGLKLVASFNQKQVHFTIKKFKKGLKLEPPVILISFYFTIK
ncbi:hypothetical protein C7P60_08835, partial [Campylobacter jejuni]|nr:hypothetical protein [Campylobacter jejuni]